MPKKNVIIKCVFSSTMFLLVKFLLFFVVELSGPVAQTAPAVGASVDATLATSRQFCRSVPVK